MESRYPEMSRISPYGGASPIRPLRVIKGTWGALVLCQGLLSLYIPLAEPCYPANRTDLSNGSIPVWKARGCRPLAEPCYPIYSYRPIERTYSTDLYPFGNRSVWKLVYLEIDPFGSWFIWK